MSQTTIIRRIRHASWGRGRICVGTADAAIARHLRALKLAPRPVEWTPDGFRGAHDALAGKEDMRWKAAELKAWKAAGWPIQRGSEMARDPAKSGRNFAVVEAWHYSWKDTDHALHEAMMDLTIQEYLPLHPPRRAGQCAALAAADQPALRKAWSPFIDAFEAGLWVFWVLEDRVIALARPELTMEDGRIHCDSGPAVLWPHGEPWWFWRGIQVLAHVVRDPVEARDILNEENVEVRRILLERFGAERFLRETGARPIQEDECGRLYAIWFRDDDPVVMVRVVNATPEPDGSRREYFLRVPPSSASARAAVAWTFGLQAEEYRPFVET